MLLLQHAFESHGAIRVQLKTDLLNVRSQTAIERIGGKKEGTLRNHMIVQPLPRLGLFQHLGFGVAGSEGKPAAAVGPHGLEITASSFPGSLPPFREGNGNA